MTPVKVLSAGTDSGILSTESEILRRAGYLVWSSDKAQNAKLLLGEVPFDLVVVGHALQPTERTEIGKAIPTHTPVFFAPAKVYPSELVEQVKQMAVLKSHMSKAASR